MKVGDIVVESRTKRFEFIVELSVSLNCSRILRQPGYLKMQVGDYEGELVVQQLGFEDLE